MDDENSTDSQKSPGDQEFNNSALKTPVSNTSLNKKWVMEDLNKSVQKKK